MSHLSRLLARRQFLAGAGSVLAIPLLHSALPRSARAAANRAAGQPIQRLMLAHMPAGLIPEASSGGQDLSKWVPSTTGSTFSLPDALSSMTNVQKSMLLLSNMQHDAAQNAGSLGSEGRHSRGLCSLFTGMKPTPGLNLALKDFGRISMDQIFAKSVAGQTSLGSLHLSLNNQGDGDAQYPDVACSAVSWLDKGSPVGNEEDPAKVFDKYFAVASTSANASQQAYLRTLRKSVLDGVLDQATSLQAKLNAADKITLDQYFTSVRALEQQFATAASASCSQGTRPADGLDADRGAMVDARAAAMMDLMALAFQCDLTRAITFTFGTGHSGIFYNFLQNFQYARHEATHHGNTQGDAEKMIQWEIATLTRFWEGLQKIPDGNGTLLDNHVSLVSSEVNSGYEHQYTNHGVLIVGSGGGFITPGRHVRAGTDNSFGNLTEVELAILQGLGTGTTSFGDYNVTTAMNLKT